MKILLCCGGTVFFGDVLQRATRATRGQPQTVEQAAEPRKMVYVGREIDITGLVKRKSTYDLVGLYLRSTL